MKIHKIRNTSYNKSVLDLKISMREIDTDIKLEENC